MERKFIYACVTCPECGHLMVVTAVGHNNPDFKNFDAGWLKCQRGHVRNFKAKDMRVVTLDQQATIAERPDWAR
jgi:hypothetical protein